jgi:diguanylate cyclase (GGDEF)-like protein
MPFIASVGAVHFDGEQGPGDLKLMLLVAFILSYAVLDAACRVRGTHGHRRTAWLIGGSLVVGLGIFAFHLIALLSVELPVPLSADPVTFGVSAVTAVIAAAGALHHVNRGAAGLPPLAISAGLKGFALVATQYTSVAGLHIPATIDYRPLMVTASVVIAVAVSGFGLVLAERLRSESPGRAALERVAGALCMALGLVALHEVSTDAGSFVADDVWGGYVLHAHQLHQLGQVWMVPWVVGAGVVTVAALGVAATLSRRARWREQASPCNDRLTGLANGAVLRQHLSTALAEGRPCTVVGVRIERFEQIKQSLGRADADRLLVRVGQRLRSAARPSDLVTCPGPAELAVLIADDRAEVAQEVAARITERLAAPIKLGPLEVVVPAVVGVAAAASGDQPADVVRRAHARPALTLLAGGLGPDAAPELRAA